MTMAVQLAKTDTTVAYKEGTDLFEERTFDAPRDLVWRVMNDRDAIPRWWGPRGYTTTVAEMDVRPGGRWRFVQQAPDGSVHPFKGEFREIVPPERLVLTFIYDVPVIRDSVAVITYTLEDRGDKTKVVARTQFPDVESLEGALASGMVDGALETWDRLAEEIAKAAKETKS
jgi:uncharacterized protein YndB with AHSA1/START domain